MAEMRRPGSGQGLQAWVLVGTPPTSPATHLPSSQALHKASDGAEVDLVAAVNRMAMDADKAEAAAAGGLGWVLAASASPVFGSGGWWGGCAGALQSVGEPHHVPAVAHG